MRDRRKRIIGIDYGTKRVGLAVSDPLLMFAQPHGTYDADETVERLVRLEADPGIEAIVVGWPLTLDGREGKAVEFVRPFVNRLRNRFPGIRIITWDERFSSERAKGALVDAGVKKKDRRSKNRINAAAAAVILQEYLDERRTAGGALPDVD